MGLFVIANLFAVQALAGGNGPASDPTLCNRLLQIQAALQASRPDLAAKIGEVAEQLGGAVDPGTVVHSFEGSWRRALLERKICLGEAPRSEHSKIQAANFEAVREIRWKLLEYRNDPRTYTAVVEWFNGVLAEIEKTPLADGVPAVPNLYHLKMVPNVIEGVRVVLDAQLSEVTAIPFIPPYAYNKHYPHIIDRTAASVLTIRERWIESLRGTIYFDEAANLYDTMVTRLAQISVLVEGTQGRQRLQMLDHPERFYARR